MNEKVAGLDFATLALRDALDLAVLIEEEARDRYAELAEQLASYDTPDASAFFLWMSGNEEHHRRSLRERRAQLFGDEPSHVRREMIFDVEAPGYDEAGTFMSRREALEACMRSEVKAHDFFAAAIGRILDPAVRALFEELRDEEVEHQQLVRKEIARLPAEPALQAKDVADDPVAQ